MKEFSGQTFVVKFGGHAMGDENLYAKFAQDIVLMKQVGINPVVVHGGGPQIGEMLNRLKIESSFIDGLRVTDKTTVEIVEMVLSGSINKKLVESLNQAGGHAVGISGKDDNLIFAERLDSIKNQTDSNIEKALDLGYVGEPKRINPNILKIFEQSDIIPVIAPIGIGEKGETYNINADTVAGAIASSLKATKLIILTDVEGIIDKNNNLINKLSYADAQKILKNGTISGGMIPKIETCLSAISNGAEAVHILNGKTEHVILLEVFTDNGVGTKITRTY
ncbi:acetylglutamate kinase [Alphaproteobacteria bacterium]|nr:acetylglutamate kinase [Alphaproteobacteria bacterium]